MKHKAIVFFVFSLIVLSCTERKLRTPKAYQNTIKLDADGYAKHKGVLTHQMRELITRHEQSFHSAEYYDSTELQIDTILYSKDYQKVILFVLTKNPVNRQLKPDKNYDWYYDAFCYLGMREQEGFRLKWMKPFSVSSFDGEMASGRIKDLYFTEFATLKGINDEYKYKYNLDDKRFWDDSVWREYFPNEN